MKQKQWENTKPVSPEMTAALKVLYDETSPDRIRFEQDLRRIFSTEELIEGAYKQAGYVIETNGNKA